MVNLEENYPKIESARASIAQGQYEHALEIYSEILDSVNPDDETVPYLYVEYSNALIKNANEFFMEEVAAIAENRGFSLLDRHNIEDDLESAWNLLEISKSAFTILRDDKHLATTHFLLGEISLLNNQYKEAIHDYTESINTFLKIYDEADLELLDVYLSMANAYEFSEDFDMGIFYYKKAIVVYKRVEESSLEVLDKENVNGLIVELLNRIKGLEKKKAYIEDARKIQTEDNFDDVEDEIVIDINNCKRRIN
jgi:tetratricopeptide (TPR) repeat protein